MTFGGIDIGTTGCKITVYEENGTIRFASSVSYPFARSAGNSSFDAGMIMDAVLQVLSQAVNEVPQLNAIGVCSFGEAFVLLDQEDRILYPTLLNTDPRGIQEVQDFVDCCGEVAICQITGAKAHSMFSAAKILWIKKHEPDIWKQVDKLLLMEDYVVYKLTGIRQIDFALASRTQLFDIHALSWSSELLDKLHISPKIFSKPVPPGTNAGKIRKNLVEQIGCSDQLQVVTCCHDQIAAAIGSGVLRPGCAVDGAGTHECITPVFSQLKKKEMMYESNLAIVPFVDHQYVTYAFLFTGCALTEWFIDTLAGHMVCKAEKEGISVFQMLEREMKEGPTGILVLPHFNGAATPYMDEGSKGAFVGMTVGTSEADLYQAVMEGIAYEMRVNMERAREAGLDVQELHATGGGANSEKWMQIKADVLNVPIKTLRDNQAGVVGAIILIGKAMGVYQSLEDGINKLVKIDRIYMPNPENHLKYNRIYEKYQRLYTSIRPFMN